MKFRKKTPAYIMVRLIVMAIHSEVMAQVVSTDERPAFIPNSTAKPSDININHLN